MRKDFLSGVGLEKGRFRSFLLACLKHFLADEWEKARTVKRGGNYSEIPLNLEGAEERYQLEACVEADAESLYERRWAVGHRHEVRRVCFSADGRKLFSGARDGSVYRWPAQTPPARKDVEVTQTDLSNLALSPETTQFAGIKQGGVCLGDTRSGEFPRFIAALGTNNTTLNFSRDGQYLYAGTRAGEIQVWSLNQEKMVQTLCRPAEPVRHLRQDSSGRTLFAVQRAYSLIDQGPSRFQVWNTATWQPQASWTNPRLHLPARFHRTDGVWPPAISQAWCSFGIWWAICAPIAWLSPAESPTWPSPRMAVISPLPLKKAPSRFEMGQPCAN